MEFVKIIVDFIVLGAIGLFCSATLILWYVFCEACIFDQGYLAWLGKRKVLKTIVILLSGTLIWGGLLFAIHEKLWTGESIPRSSVEQRQGRSQ